MRGINLSRGVADGSGLDTAVRNANATYAAARLAAEMAKQVAVENAKNVLRASGDSGA
jgi:K+-transporting ATPase c subunit